MEKATQYTTFTEVCFPAITERAQAEDLLGILLRYRGLTIGRFDSHEPIRKVFRVDSVGDMAKSVFNMNTIYWIGIDGLSRGSISLQKGLGKQTAWLRIQTDVEKIEGVGSLIETIKAIISRFGATYAYVHYLSKPEIARGLAADTVTGNAENPYMMIMTRWKLVRCVPDLYWANVFGPEYVKLFGGRNRVASAPAPVVLELAPDTFYIQLSENILDMASNGGEIDRVREHLKQYLGRDCFFDYTSGFNKIYRVPDLGWREPARAPQTPESLTRFLERVIGREQS